MTEVVSPGGGGGGGSLLRILSDRNDRMGAKIKPKKIPRASNKTEKKSLCQNLTPKKSNAEFASHKNFQKASY